MVVGLKYVGATSDFPTRITVGDVVDLRRESSPLPEFGAVAAYYNGSKVGYLSPDEETFWNSMRRSARRRASVIGEILDEDGNLAGLDIEIRTPGRQDERPANMEPEAAQIARRHRITLRTTLGLAIVLLTLAVMGRADSTDPDGSEAAFSNMTLDELSEVDRFWNAGLTQIVTLTRADQVKHLSMPNQNSGAPQELVDRSAQEAQAHELDRIVQQAHAHRLAADLKQRAELALAVQKAEAQKTQQLVDAREAAAHWQAEYAKLKADQAELQRRIEEMTLAQQQLEEQERQQLALKELNVKELGRHQNRMEAWNLIGQNSGALQELGDRSAREAQAQELDRIVQQAHAHRLAADLKRRAELALREQQAEAQKMQQLAEVREAAAHWQAEYGKLEADNVRLERRIEEIKFAQQLLKEEERQQLAFKELNVEELVRHQNRIEAWNLISRKMGTREVAKTKSAQQQVLTKEAKAVLVLPTPKPIKQAQQQASKKGAKAVSAVPPHPVKSVRKQALKKVAKSISVESTQKPIKKRRKTNFSRYGG